MNYQTNWTKSLSFGMKVITDLNCYKTKTIVHGIADSRRPNNKKPLYRRKTIRIPTAFIVDGVLICHPDWHDKMLKLIGKKMNTDIENMARAAFTGA